MTSKSSVYSFVKGCATKVRYVDIASADRGIIEARKKYGTELFAYPCEHCLGYHLTSSPKGSDVLKRTVQSKKITIEQSELKKLQAELTQAKHELHQERSMHVATRNKIDKAIRHNDALNGIIIGKNEEIRRLGNQIYQMNQKLREAKGNKSTLLHSFKKFIKRLRSGLKNYGL